ncbi:MAG: hypothetical protein HZC41_04005 [Chloroflexi bacterium]|nr:hypothetical protein [Chloroflexota bacterium]
MRKIAVLLIVVLLAASCQVVPTTGDTASDAAAAQNYLPNLAGFTATEASSISEALTKVGAGASALTGNLPMAGLIAKLDDTLRCYQQVGAVAARVYTEQNVVGAVTEGSIPRIGVVAVVNTTRVQRNLFSCVLNTGVGAQAQAQAATIQPCGGSGSFTVNNETLQYVYAATAPEVCAAFQSAFPRQ